MSGEAMMEIQSHSTVIYSADVPQRDEADNTDL